ncbi:HEAT repeat-containing protein 5B isoform X2 [Sorghum bicolor]|uniref:HEAT repeat-containing protein 5B isoform X2 n=1 Tax=Sorghum bicolor TaxID=4558 RepID=UPI000B425CE6|nr:HEAT repeat-containing protein 5B isoform X2 [Sorghum bicolor]|eukprot:XP_021304666.1 HEAT repeat-containing protein 5B isoform X2 [Sorghum bicolor]
MAKGVGGGELPLSRFGALVAQLESVVASARQKTPDALLCFDLLSELSSAIDEAPKETIQLWQRKCEDALQSLLVLGARRPVRRLASSAMGRIIEKGDVISVYSRASNLQGWLVDVKRAEAIACAGAAQCLGEIYRLFGRKITAGLIETSSIVAKLMKYHEDFVRQDALLLLENALEGSGGGGAAAAYQEAFRIIMRGGVSDKSFIVRVAAARCLKAFANIGGPALGIVEFDSSMSYCVKGLEDSVSSVRDSFAEALGAILALSVNPDAQVKKGGKKQTASAKKIEDGVQKHLIVPFVKANGANAKKLRIGLALSWVFFLHMIHMKYGTPDSELQNYAIQAMEILQGNDSPDPHALACVLYVLRVGVADQMTEPAQREFLVFLGRKLESSNYTAPMRVATLRILSYLLRSVGEVPAEFKDVLDNTVVAALSHSSAHVRVEAALTLRALAEVDPTCVGGLVSYGLTTLQALRETVSFDKGKSLNLELDSLHGQATVLAALVVISPKLLLGYPARLPKSVLELSKKMLNGFSRNPVAAIAEREAGWLLLASLLASMPKEELEDQVFDVLLLWAGPFTGNPESYLRHIQDWASELRVLSVAIEALTAFIRSFVYPIVTTADGGILLNPVLAYLGGALSLISSLRSKQVPNVRSALDLFTTRTLMAYRSLLNPVVYKTEHQQMLQLCSSPFSDPSGWEESSCLKFLLDKRDASLGPWIPGRDSFEDELRAFDGGADGFLPCVWDDEISNFPQPESIRKMLVNQMLLCYGSIFACQENTVKISLLNNLDQCLKSGKKYVWFKFLVTNACVALLSGLKEFLTLRGAQSLPIDILSMIQSIFKAILVEPEISTAQRRAACEGLGLLARVGNDIFTARMARSLLGELVTATDLGYTSSVAFSLGCIHRSAGGMALSTLITPTVSSLSHLSKSSNFNLQLWSLHALLLTIEAAGLSYVSQVQGTLFLAMEILLLEENGYVDLRQGIGHLINAIVAVLGPELAPGSTFFSRCKSVIAEISSSNEMATLLESVRFSQQLVLFAPQAVPVHLHVRGLIPTLYSRQPSLRYLAVSTLRHLIERDPAAMIDENIEENLFSMLDEETDSEIAMLVRATIIRLLYTSCPLRPSRWLAVLRNIVLATSIRRNTGEVLSSFGHNPPDSTSENDVYYGEDEDNMISSSKQEQVHWAGSISSQFPPRNKHLRYRTRVFAAECVSHVPIAVGAEPAHFDLLLARSAISNGTNDWLVLKLQELVSLSYQISTGQFEGMQPIGVKLLCLIMDKFGKAVDPEFPGHILLEQFQAQLVSAVRMAISTASGPLLLEAGLELATRVMTSSIIGGDRVALSRLFSLITRPLSDIEGLFYPSFADWVVCKIKVRLLTAHAAVKCNTYQFLRMKENVPNEYQQLVPSLVNSSTLLGKYWIRALKDYVSISFGLHSKINYKPFLDGIQSLLVSSKVQRYLDEVWLLILQATALDAAPVEFDENKPKNLLEQTFISGHCMVKLDRSEFQFLWGLSVLVLFHSCQSVKNNSLKINLDSRQNKKFGEFMVHRLDNKKPCDQVLPVLLSLTTEVFFSNNFLSVDICQEVLQALTYADCSSAPIIHLFTQIIRFCPDNFFEVEAFVSSALELLSRYLGVILQCRGGSSQNHSSNTLISELSIASETMACRIKGEYLWKLMMLVVSTSHQSFQQVPTNLCLSNIISFLQNILPFMRKCFRERAESDGECMSPKVVFGAMVGLVGYFYIECDKKISLLENKISDSYKLLTKILLFCLGEATALAKLVPEIVYQSENVSNNDVLLWGSFRLCVQVIQGSLRSTNIQMHMLGLHVLRSYAQKELTEGSETKIDSFVMLLMELLGDLFLVMQTTLKECSNKESVSVIDECLKLLFLFHTLAQSKRYQQDATTLLLEALLMIFNLSSDTVSQELAEVNTISRKLFSHFIQIPSVAIQIKDIMLSAPPERRVQLQDMVRASVSQGQIMVPAAVSAHSEQNVQDNSSINPGSTAEGSDCVATHRKNENEVDDDWDDDWDAFQSLPASANDGVDSGEISLTTRYNEQTPQENISHGSSSVDITAGAMEDITCVDKELEEPSDLQFSSTEQQDKHESPGSSHEDCDELERLPSVDCKEQLAHNETADELPQVHEDIDQVIEDTKVVSAEIHGIEVDVHDDIVEDDSPINSNNLSNITEDDNASRVDSKFVKDDNREELSGSSDADAPDFSMSGNVMSESGGNDQLRG